MTKFYTALMVLVPDAECIFIDNKIAQWHDTRPQPTQTEIDAKIADLEAEEPMRLLRIERNRRLAETDWVTIKAYSQSLVVSEEWKTYLQSLRDLPETQEPKLDDQGNLTNVDWPEVPE